MEDVLIKVENVSKKFSKDLKTSLKYGFFDAGREIFGLKHKAELRPTEFWAVKNISFEVKRGESIGLIGHNGAGKSTLLKMLNGLIKPDEGRIEMKGKIGALIELGAGFNPVLTGRENIYINAAVLGFNKKKFKENFKVLLIFLKLVILLIHLYKITVLV
jgi:lipopolysaccharide transport system ATP-binding protein